MNTDSFAFLGGFCQVPDYSWIDWWKGQVERVWDLSDILYLTFAQKGIDPLFKSYVNYLQRSNTH